MLHKYCWITSRCVETTIWSWRERIKYSWQIICSSLPIQMVMSKQAQNYCSFSGVLTSGLQFYSFPFSLPWLQGDRMKQRCLKGGDVSSCRALSPGAGGSPDRCQGLLRGSMSKTRSHPASWSLISMAHLWLQEREVFLRSPLYPRVLWRLS